MHSCSQVWQSGIRIINILLHISSRVWSTLLSSRVGRGLYRFHRHNMSIQAPPLTEIQHFKHWNTRQMFDFSLEGFEKNSSPKLWDKIQKDTFLSTTTNLSKWTFNNNNDNRRRQQTDMTDDFTSCTCTHRVTSFNNPCTGTFVWAFSLSWNSLVKLWIQIKDNEI